MSNHLVVHITDKETLFLIINDEHKVIKTSCPSNLEPELRKNIDRVIVVPETSSIQTTFISLTIGATDNFHESLINKLTNNYYSTKNTVIKYKIVSENHSDKSEYLLSVLIIPIDLYKTMSKKLTKIVKKKTIQWIPANYCLTLSIIESSDFTETPLIIHITEKQTNIIIKTGTEINAISTLPFSIEKLKICMREDGFSDNQINNKLNLRLNFDKELGFNTRLLVNDTLSDIQKEVQFICSINKLSIKSCYIIADQLKHSDLANILSEKMLIPCQYAPLPETNANSALINIIQEKKLITIIEKAVAIVQNMQIFITYIPKKVNADDTIPKKIIDKEIASFIAASLLTLSIILIVSFNMSKSLEVKKATLYGLKDLSTATKAQYIDITESLYNLKQLEKLEERLDNQSKDNNAITLVTQTIIRNLPPEIPFSEITIQLRNRRITVSGKSKKEEPILKYLKNLNSSMPNNKILLKRIHPETPLRFTIEVQL